MGNKPVCISTLSSIHNPDEMKAYLEQHRVKDSQVCEIISNQ